ncbi:MAG: DUF366 family protein [Candidatus Eisenbacteria bacterium]
MKTKFVEERVDYSGRELRSHWLKECFGLEGDAVAGFAGSCRVVGEDLVDLEDFELGLTVEGDRMLHFIVEIFGVGLPGIVFAQRLLCATARELINSGCGKALVDRRGDDLFVGDRKLSVSVATVSGVSGLIHLGLNITREGVPVKAASLDDMGVDYASLAEKVLSKFADEIDSCIDASKKVRPVS